MHKYVTLKLTTGENVVGRLHTTSDECVTVDNPVTMAFGYDFEGNLGVKYTHYMPFSTQTLFTFRRKYIILQSDLSEKFIAYYESFISEDEGLEEDNGVTYLRPDKSKLN